VATVLEEVAPAFERLRRAGKTRFLGITAIGETDALQRVVDARAFDTAQVPYNMLNPSAGTDLPPGYPGQDYGALFERTRAAGMGVIGIRVLAGGALSGLEERHPLGMPAVEPIASGADYRTDVARARRLATLIAEGHAGSLVEAALRFAIANEAVGTVLVGYSTLDQLEDAAAAVAKGPLPPAALDRLRTLREGFLGETR
jgi:L-galactose dehydrogenase/L-glyceraldehyde 3-phosphate reductase